MVSAAIGTGGERLHLDAGAVDGVDLRLDLDVGVLDPEVHVDRADEQRVAQRQQVRGLLRGLDAGHPGDREHVALGDGAGGDLRRGVGLHVHAAAGDGPTVGGVLGGDVDHAGTAERVEMGELRGRHRTEV